jgi:Plant transposon protein
VKNYFNGRESIYSEVDFERRFRTPRAVLNRIYDAVMGQHPFIHYEDATKKKGIYPLVKLVACFRYLAYGDAYDQEDENLDLSGSALRNIAQQFTKLIVKEFGPMYLNRYPTVQERKNISSIMASRGFPGCLASWDCKHFNWKNCPMRLAGQYKGHSEGGKKTIILEAIADHRKYFWAVNFGDAGSLNDLNVLDKSSIIGAMLSGELRIDIEPYTINGNDRDWMYYLVDGIYPEWAIFVSTCSTDATRDPKKKKFATVQERVRKDVECAFRILVQRYHILQRPLRNWDFEDLDALVKCCIIIHNMIVEARFGAVDYNDGDNDAKASIGATFPLFGLQITSVTRGICS